MNKYDPLYNYLTKIPSDVSEKTLPFDEIEKILGFTLPTSAYKYDEWWHPSGHSHAQLWVEAGGK